MSYYLIDFIKEVDDLNFDNIIIGRKIKTNITNSKYYLYHQIDQIESPKEIYIKLPKLRLIYNLSNHKYNQLNIPIYPNWKSTNDFIKYIKNLENNINECFINKFPEIKFVSLITKKDNLHFIKANISDDLKITSDINDEKITFNEFKLNGQIEIVIKLSYLWNKNDTKIGLSSELYQIKYCAPPSQLNINFIDFEKPKSITKYIPPSITSQNNITYDTHLPLPPQVNFKVMLSENVLQNALKSLNKTKN